MDVYGGIHVSPEKAHQVGIEAEPQVHYVLDRTCETKNHKHNVGDCRLFIAKIIVDKSHQQAANDLTDSEGNESKEGPRDLGVVVSAIFLLLVDHQVDEHRLCIGNRHPCPSKLLT